MDWIVTLVLLAIVLLLVLIFFNRRIRQLEQLSASQEKWIRNLTQRVFLLERSGSPKPAEEVRLPPVVAPEPIPTPIPEPAPEPSAEIAFGSAPMPPVPESEDWEAVIGGNLLNKAGALILIIGIALFLGYSLKQFGPPGKIAIGLGIGLSLLTGGLRLERNPIYAIFAHGLIAAGWAAIYFTTYAAHGLPASKIVHDPALAAALLLLVSALMIWHSFRYRSQPVSALAFFIAFVSLNLTGLTPFAAGATVLLAIVAMAVAVRYEWRGVAVVGVALTYFTFLYRYDSAFYSRFLPAMAVAWSYWLTFEIYDLIDLRRRGAKREWRGLLFWLNAIGFFLCAVNHHGMQTPRRWEIFFLTAGAAYLITAVVRFWLTSVREGAFIPRLFSGNWEGAAFAAAVYFYAAGSEFASGLRLALIFLALGQTIVIAGLLFRERFLQNLGCLGLAGALLQLADHGSPPDIVVLGRRFHAWTPAALLMAAVFTVNRFLAANGLFYSFGASLLVAAVVGAEVAKAWVAVVWAAFLCVAIYAGVRWNRLELRIQGYLIAFAALIAAVGGSLEGPDRTERIVTVSLVSCLFWAAQFLLRIEEPIERIARAAFSLAGTFLITMLIVNESQGRVLTVALGIEGIALVVFGFLARERIQRLCGLSLFLVCIAKLFLWDLRELDTLSRILSFIVLGLMLLGASWLYVRFREQIRKIL